MMWLAQVKQEFIEFSDQSHTHLTLSSEITQIFPAPFLLHWEIDIPQAFPTVLHQFPILTCYYRPQEWTVAEIKANNNISSTLWEASSL